MSEIPAHAVSVDYGTIFKKITRQLKGARQGVLEVVRTVSCPGCDNTYDDRGANITTTCHQCGWSVRYEGDTFVWPPLSEAAE